MGAMNDLMIDRMNAEKRFFSHISADHWTAKNKLEEAAHNLAREMDRILVPEHKVQDFLIEFDNKMKELFRANPRCKPLEFSWHKGYVKEYEEWWIYCDGVFQMSLIEVKLS